MRDRNRADLLLVEILIAVFFFMLSLTVLVQLFAAARNTVLRANAETVALQEAQNILEELYGSADAETLLTGEGFISSHGVYTKQYEDYSLLVELSEKKENAGMMKSARLMAYPNLRPVGRSSTEVEALFVLPCIWYLPAEGTAG